jgi:hypothetical protein
VEAEIRRAAERQDKYPILLMNLINLRIKDIGVSWMDESKSIAYFDVVRNPFSVKAVYFELTLSGDRVVGYKKNEVSDSQGF